jgi:hypothetical protein
MKESLYRDGPWPSDAPLAGRSCAGRACTATLLLLTQEKPILLWLQPRKDQQ